jgi:hypothetical protein
MGDVDFNLSDGSHVTLSGSAANINARGSNGSHFNLGAFSVINADINFSDGAQATINVDGTLNVDLNSYSDVIYIGQPTMGDIDVSSDSTLNQQ